MLICVTHGQCTQLIDFKPVSCQPGALLIVRPGQAHNFGQDKNWNGWIVLFRPEFLLPTLSLPGNIKLSFDFEKLSEFLSLNADELCRASDSICRMHEDSLTGTSENIQILLRYQLYALVTWLGVIHDQQNVQDALYSRSLLRFTRFQKTVEQHFTEWRQVSDYARDLGCTEKSLTRATSAIAGVSAKMFISERINLEAKRLLAHTCLPVGVIAIKLGFEEATHFSKFFRRETGFTPSVFRQQYLVKSMFKNKTGRAKPVE